MIAIGAWTNLNSDNIAHVGSWGGGGCMGTSVRPWTILPAYKTIANINFIVIYRPSCVNHYLIYRCFIKHHSHIANLNCKYFRRNRLQYINAVTINFSYLSIFRFAFPSVYKIPRSHLRDFLCECQANQNSHWSCCSPIGVAWASQIIRMRSCRNSSKL